MPRKRKARSPWPLILMVVGLALMAGAIVWFASINPTQNPAGVQATEAGLQIPFPDVPRVGLEEAYEAYQAQSAVFVDVRGEPFYSEAHIPGALNTSLTDLPNQVQQLDPGAWIITYCT